MSKKFLSVLLALVMAVVLLPAYGAAGAVGSAGSDAQFSDMPDDWSTEALMKAISNGWLEGFDDGTLKPESPVTRAQMATIIVRAFGYTEEGDLSGYTDVKETDWYYSSIAKAYKMGVIQGYEGLMRPNDPITREEAFVMLARALKLEPASTLDETFEDSDQISDWAKGEIYALINAGYIKGSGDGKLNPQADIKRNEFAQVMFNVDELIPDQVDAAVAEVDALIAALPAAGEVKLTDKAQIEEARAAYDALTEAQQALVKDVASLEAAEAELAALQVVPVVPVVPVKYALIKAAIESDLTSDGYSSDSVKKVNYANLTVVQHGANVTITSGDLVKVTQKDFPLEGFGGYTIPTADIKSTEFALIAWMVDEEPHIWIIGNATKTFAIEWEGIEHTINVEGLDWKSPTTATISLEGEEDHTNFKYGNTDLAIVNDLNVTGTLKYHETDPTEMSFPDYEHHFMVFKVAGLEAGATVTVTGLANKVDSSKTYTLTGESEVFVWGVEAGETIGITVDRDGAGTAYSEKKYTLDLSGVTLEAAPPVAAIKLLL